MPHRDVEYPARIDWIFGSDSLEQTPIYTDEIADSNAFIEGTRTRVYVNRYERDRNARDACIRYYGARCAVCNFDFESTYGEIGIGFIHVHHKTLISELGVDYLVDPIEDLIPVCPNCHAMLHIRNPPLTIIELQQQMR